MSPNDIRQGGRQKLDPAEPGFRYTRKVFFYETRISPESCISAAIFATWKRRSMRSGARRGFTVDRAGAGLGYPRVSATFDYRSPLFFEDELTVVARVHAVTERTIKYSFVFTRGDTAVGTGWLTTACATRQDDGSMRAVAIPPGGRFSAARRRRSGL